MEGRWIKCKVSELDGGVVGGMSRIPAAFCLRHLDGCPLK